MVHPPIIQLLQHRYHEAECVESHVANAQAGVSGVLRVGGSS